MDDTLPPHAAPPVTPPLAYQSPMPFGRDLEHLKLLAIGHYLYGALTMACSSFFIVYIVIGYMALKNPAMFNPPATTGPASTAPSAPLPPRAPAPPPGPPPQLFGWMFAGMGTTAVVVGWTTGILTIISGRCIRKQRARLFSMIVAGLNCLNVPLGTALGVLTYLVLLRDTVVRMYRDGGQPAV
jgi:hypothetical protein